MFFVPLFTRFYHHPRWLFGISEPSTVWTILCYYSFPLYIQGLRVKKLFEKISMLLYPHWFLKEIYEFAPSGRQSVDLCKVDGLLEHQRRSLKQDDPLLSEYCLGFLEGAMLASGFREVKLKQIAGWRGQLQNFTSTSPKIEGESHSYGCKINIFWDDSLKLFLSSQTMWWW